MSIPTCIEDITIYILS